MKKLTKYIGPHRVSNKQMGVEANKIILLQTDVFSRHTIININSDNPVKVSEMAHVCSLNMLRSLLMPICHSELARKCLHPCCEPKCSPVYLAFHMKHVNICVHTRVQGGLSWQCSFGSEHPCEHCGSLLFDVWSPCNSTSHSLVYVNLREEYRKDLACQTSRA